jgi:hypothetical protein
MAVMMVAMAAPAFAKAAHLSDDNLERDYALGGEPCEPKGVITPSGNTNLQCKIKDEGSNSGGSGGGGAATGKATEEDPVLVPKNPEEDFVETDKAHAAATPSGNGTIHGHYNPKANPKA